MAKTVVGQTTGPTESETGDLVHDLYSALSRCCGYMVLVLLCFWVGFSLHSAPALRFKPSVFYRTLGDYKLFMFSVFFLPLLVGYVFLQETPAFLTALFKNAKEQKTIQFLQQHASYLVVLLVILALTLIGGILVGFLISVNILFLGVVHVAFSVLYLVSLHLVRDKGQMLNMFMKYLVFALLVYMTPFIYAHIMVSENTADIAALPYILLAGLITFYLWSLDLFRYITQFRTQQLGKISEEELRRRFYLSSRRMMLGFSFAFVLLPSIYLIVDLYGFIVPVFFTLGAATYIVTLLATKDWEDMEDQGTVPPFIKVITQFSFEKHPKTGPNQVLLWTRRVTAVILLLSVIVGRFPVVVVPAVLFPIIIYILFFFGMRFLQRKKGVISAAS